MIHVEASHTCIPVRRDFNVNLEQMWVLLSSMHRLGAGLYTIANWDDGCVFP